ncbi:MAG: S41 family peptidase [Spirochaetes bacterium]|nr:S41 family peptidase [Spirochaetota bacterium]
MTRRFRERHFHLIVLAFMLGIFFGINIAYLARANEPAHRYLDYFHKVYQLIRTEAVDMPSSKHLFYGAIRGMMRSLNDPYSRFLDERAFRELKEVTTGKFVGVGIEITSRNKEIVVITPIEGSPAMEQGIMTGDIIKKVNDKSIRGMNLPDVVKMIKGLPGSSVRLSIQREGVEDPIELDLKRMPIRIKSVEYNVMDSQRIGYIKIKNFGTDTVKDVIDALNSFNKQKVHKVIVDLRNNPGGLLTSAVELSELFIEKGQTIVTTKGRQGSGSVTEYKSEKDPLYRGELVVLVNEGSASASEIFAAAIRDNRRGKLVGEKTFGKGSVQKTFNLDDNIAVAITVAKYYTPSGELIHGKGIMPDYRVQFEMITARDRKGLLTLQQQQLLDKFVTPGMEYTEETKSRFIQYLRGHDISLSERTAHFILKRRISSFKKQALYDTEFDTQLTTAIDVVMKKK